MSSKNDWSGVQSKCMTNCNSYLTLMIQWGLVDLIVKLQVQNQLQRVLHNVINTITRHFDINLTSLQKNQTRTL